MESGWKIRGNWWLTRRLVCYGSSRVFRFQCLSVCTVLYVWLCCALDGHWTWFWRSRCCVTVTVVQRLQAIRIDRRQQLRKPKLWIDPRANFNIRYLWWSWTKINVVKLCLWARVKHVNVTQGLWTPKKRKVPFSRYIPIIHCDCGFYFCGGKTEEFRYDACNGSWIRWSVGLQIINKAFCIYLHTDHPVIERNVSFARLSDAMQYTVGFYLPIQALAIAMNMAWWSWPSEVSNNK